MRRARCAPQAVRRHCAFREVQATQAQEGVMLGKEELQAVRERAAGADPAAHHDVRLLQADRAALLDLVAYLQAELTQFPPRDAQRWHSVRDAVHRNDYRASGLAKMADDDCEDVVVRLLNRIGASERR